MLTQWANTLCLNYRLARAKRSYYSNWKERIEYSRRSEGMSLGKNSQKNGILKQQWGSFGWISWAWSCDEWSSCKHWLFRWSYCECTIWSSPKIWWS